VKHFGAWLSEGIFVYRFIKNFAVCLVVLVLVGVLVAQFVHQGLTYRVVLAMAFSLGWGLLQAWSHDRS